MALAAGLVCGRFAAAQTIQFPTTSPTTAVPATPGAATVITPPGGGAATSINPYTGSFPTVPFDPYSSSGAPAYQFWSNTPPSNTTGVFGQPPASPYGATTPFVQPGTTPLAPPGTMPIGQPGGLPSFGPPPASPYAPTTPQVLFPDGIGQPLNIGQSIRFIQDIRFRHTWLHGGDNPRDLDINDSEVAVTFTLPNFLTTGQPLFISPAFALHLWDGPSHMPADLPAQAYSAYLDFQWASDPNLQIGAELGFRIGVYSDFNTLNSDSLRIQGLGLGVARLTPNLTFKLGAMYLDRNRIKLLPAGGFFWTPTPQVRFDIFFPQPKLSAYLTTVGRHEVWWYLAGEYGGGAWTIEREAGFSDRIDINDLRASAGIEWFGPAGFHGFFEVGYVFEREVIYVVTPAHSFEPRDTFMLRAGLSF